MILEVALETRSREIANAAQEDSVSDDFFRTRMRAVLRTLETLSPATSR
jgi:hypothetical protein